MPFSRKEFALILALVLCLVLAVEAVAAYKNRDEFPGRRQGGGTWGREIVRIYDAQPVPVFPK